MDKIGQIMFLYLLIIFICMGSIGVVILLNSIAILIKRTKNIYKKVD